MFPLSPAEPLVDAFAGVADLFYGRSRPSGLLGFVPHFVVLPPGGQSCSGPRAVFFFAAAI
jgi:hypothetical protein